jgi:membrane protease subunit HflK
MAWNQPGGDGRDPWNDRGGQRGPPDLDEVLRKVQARLGQLFGGRPGRRSGSGGGGDGGSGAGGGGRGGGIGALGVGIVAALVVLAWGAYGIYVVDPAEAGVVLRFGQYVRTTGPGPHWVPPFVESVEKVNVQVIRSQDIGFRTQGSSSVSVAHESLMLTEDENIVLVDLVVQYRRTDPEAYLFNLREPEATLQDVTSSAIREVVGKNLLDFILTEGRAEIAAETQTLIQSTLDFYGTGITVYEVNLQDANFPPDVEASVQDAIRAREDRERMSLEAQAYSNDVIPRARGAAAREIQAAEGYRARVTADAEGEADRFEQILREYEKAPEVTRQRLYIETLEQVLANSTKVLLDAQGGNNLLYLPLDRLVERRGDSAPNGLAPSSSPAPITSGLSSSARLRDSR